MTSAPVLALPNFTLPSVLETDASGQGIGVVLMQQGKPIAYYSAVFCPTNWLLSTYEKEALGTGYHCSFEKVETLLSGH